MNQNKQNTTEAGPVREQALAFLHALEIMLRPICRMLLRRGFDFHHASDVLKRAFVSACGDVLKEQKLPVTEKRISLFTRLPWREVARLFPPDRKPAVDLSGAKFTQITALFTAWHLDPRFAEPFTGLPRALFLREAEGSPSFEELVREFAPTLDADELREELEHLKAVSMQQETGLLRLTARAYIPTPYSTDDSERFGRMMSSYANTMDANSRKEAPGKGMFDRHVTADFRISKDDESEFHLFVRAEGQRFLEQMDQWLAARQREDASESFRPGVAMFYYYHNDATADPDTATASSMDRKTDLELTQIINSKDPNDPDIIDTLSFRGKK